MARSALRLLGFLLGAFAAVHAALAAVFRMDDANELNWILWVDLVVGFWLAAALVLLRIPDANKGSWRWHVATFVGGIVTWAAVSGCLAYWHLLQFRIRFTPPRLPEG